MHDDDVGDAFAYTWRVGRRKLSQKTGLQTIKMIREA